MSQIDSLIKKIKSTELKKSDIDEFIKFVTESVKITETQKSIIEDNIEWLKAISFLFGKWESGNFRITGNDWKEARIEFQKLKRIIDEIDYEGIFAHKIWGLGGNCFLDVVDKSLFLQFLYDRISVLVSKISPIVQSGLRIDSNEIPIENLEGNVVISDDGNEDEIKEEAKKESKIKIDQQQNVIYDKVFNTNLKHIESELEYTVKKLSKFNKSQEEIEKWVIQFKTDRERILALKLLNNIRYYNEENIIDFYVLAHKSLFREFEVDPNKNLFLFVPAGGAGSSGAKCAPEYRQYNHISELQIKNSLELNALEKNRFKYIVFVDDFIGTGKQASDFFKNIDFESLKDKGIERFFFVVWMAFEDGINLIEKNHKYIKVISAETLNEQDKTFSPESKVFNKDEREEARNIFERYGKKLYREGPLGYANYSALISFIIKSPNHTLPVIWSDANGWTPIFKRFYK